MSLPTRRTLNAKYLPESYNHRDILGLDPLSKWTEKHEQLHFEYNRILQPGFMYRDAQSVVNDAKLCGIEWLTDVCCPSVKAALLLHIGKEMVVNYKISEDQLNVVAHHVYENLLTKSPDIILKMEKRIQDEIFALQRDGTLAEPQLTNLANQLLEKNKQKSNLNNLSAAKRLIIDIERKAITNRITSSEVKQYLSNAEQLNLIKKPMYSLGQTHDYSILGAAGSGKSTIARQYFNDEQKSDYIVLATDNYRAFTVPGTESHEEKTTQDVFTRTQDIAYLTKELVQQEIESTMMKNQTRANVICDCITLDDNMQELLAQGKVTSVVAAYRGKPGYIGIAERADTRAKSTSAAPADKGRYVETTALLTGHAEASQRLLSSIPRNAETKIFDTNVKRGFPPILIAVVDSKSKVVEVNNLRVFSEFLNKSNINRQAVNEIELILSKNENNMLATHPEMKAKVILDLAIGSQYQEPHTFRLKDETTGAVYAELVPHDIHKIFFHILDKEKFLEKSRQDNLESTVLRALARQATLGSLEKSYEASTKLGDKVTFEQSIELMRVSKPGLSENETRVLSTLNSLIVTVDAELRELNNNHTGYFQNPLEKIESIKKSLADTHLSNLSPQQRDVFLRESMDALKSIRSEIAKLTLKKQDENIKIPTYKP